MPEQPQEPKRVPIPAPPAPEPMPAVPYAELHCCTNFSFLEGASHADELVARAAELGYTALAVTDRNSLAGMVRAHVAAKEAGLKLVVGAAIFPVDASPVLLWATDRAGYGRLSELLTVGRRSAPKGECLSTFDDLARHAEGLLTGVLLGRVASIPTPSPLGFAGGEGWGEGGKVSLRNFNPLTPALSPAKPGERGQSRPLHHLDRYRELFADRCYAVAELHRGQEDRRWLRQMVHLARQARVPLIAANDAHYHAPRRRP